MPPQVWGSHELCTHFGITRATLKRWRTLPNFPRATELACGDIWDPAEAIAWYDDWKRPSKVRRAHALDRYRKVGQIAPVARELEIDVSTLRAWLREMGEPLPSEKPRPQLPRGRG
jgi:hypothetical protein